MKTWALVSMGTLAGMVLAALITLGVAWLISSRVPVGPGSMNERMRTVLPMLLYGGPVLLIALSIVGARLGLRLADRHAVTAPPIVQPASGPDAGQR